MGAFSASHEAIESWKPGSKTELPDYGLGGDRRETREDSHEDVYGTNAVGFTAGLVGVLGEYGLRADHAQGDSFTNTADPATNHGTGALLDVGATHISYIEFNLASIPATASISQATLKLYVNAVPTAGSFNVDYVDGAWAENTIDASNAPTAGAANRFRCTSTPSPAAMVT